MIRRPPRSTLFPTRRSSDLLESMVARLGDDADYQSMQQFLGDSPWDAAEELDRKSTRLNSSHPSISYAVFCLKKKKNKGGPQLKHYHDVSYAPSRTEATDKF